MYLVYIILGHLRISYLIKIPYKLFETLFYKIVKYEGKYRSLKYNSKKKKIFSILETKRLLSIDIFIQYFSSKYR